MPKKFSIIFPTRERPELLNGILRSIYATTKNIDDVEIFISYDFDDSVTKAIIPAWPGVNWVECARSLNFSRDYYNKMGRMTEGKYIIVCNDDAVFESPEWDKLAEEEILRRTSGKDSVFMGWIEDGLGEARAKGIGQYCCFPLVGRDGFLAHGFIFPERLPTWGADCWMAQVYGIIGRIYRLPITIRHLTPHNGTRPVDYVQQRIRDNQVPFDMNPSSTEIRALKEAIRKKAALCA